MKKVKIQDVPRYVLHENHKIKTQAKEAFKILEKVLTAEPALKAGFVVDDNDKVYVCVDQSGSDFVVLLYDNWERCYKCQVLPGASKEGVSIQYPPISQRTKTLSPAKIRKEIERAILINERYKAAQKAKETAIKIMKAQVLENGGKMKKESECDFIGIIEKGGLQMQISHVQNDHFLFQLNVIAQPSIDNFLLMADNKYQAVE